MKYGKFLLINLVLLAFPFFAYAQVFRAWHDSSNVPNSQHEAYGWACITNNDAPLIIKFYDGNNYIGQATADLQREGAVGEICRGSNAQLHGFIWPYPTQITDGATHYITAKAIVDGVETPLPNTPVVVSGVYSSQIRGWLDFVTPDYVWGWACDPSQNQDEFNTTSIDLYSEEQYLGSASNQIITADVGVGGVCGTRNRSYQIAIPSYLQNYQNHTIYAYAGTSNSNRRLIGVKKAVFQAQSLTSLGVQRFVTAENIDDVIGASVIEELPPSDGLLRINSYCYGPSIDDVPITWDPSALTGFFIEDCNQSSRTCSSSRSQYQRGLIDIAGEYVVQAKGSKYGFYVKSNGFGYVPCGSDIAGTGAGFSWFPGSPTPWPSPSASSKAREVYIKYKASVSSSGGIAYVGNAFYFRDRVRNQFVWLTVQAYDTRTNIDDYFLGSDGSPIVGTSFSVSGTRGRSVMGTFVKGPTMSETDFEFRLNGYQFEQILHLAGCGSPTLTSCSAADFDMTIGFAGPETSSFNAFIGATVSDLDVGITNVGAY